MPLSPLQEGLYYQSVSDQDSTAYVLQASYELHGELDLSAIHGSFEWLLQRHSTLRTVFQLLKMVI